MNIEKGLLTMGSLFFICINHYLPFHVPSMSFCGQEDTLGEKHPFSLAFTTLTVIPLQKF
jgi:hypothetical protein